ncbi:hypothetical protein LIER_05226 [Lithospermum erythrorhizon]|uniref:Uncharacterized protein n=1 Tax=Lithospermum erythrorhizon TaxID=34254 RepID=A0AAV3P3V1_LITER
MEQAVCHTYGVPFFITLLNDWHFPAKHSYNRINLFPLYFDAMPSIDETKKLSKFYSKWTLKRDSSSTGTALVVQTLLGDLEDDLLKPEI